jgi:hypothetical protein
VVPSSIRRCGKVQLDRATIDQFRLGQLDIFHSNMHSAWTMTKPFHRAPYAAISPDRPALSQAGKTVLVTGGHAGIGYAIAKAFLQASAERVIIIGRRESLVQDAARELSQGLSGQVVLGLPCDISHPSQVDALWQTLRGQGITVDVLVLNAVKISEEKPILEVGTVGIWSDFDVNVRAQLQMTETFYKQTSSGRSRQKVSHSCIRGTFSSRANISGLKRVSTWSMCRRTPSTTGKSRPTSLATG